MSDWSPSTPALAKSSAMRRACWAICVWGLLMSAGAARLAVAQGATTAIGAAPMQSTAPRVASESGSIVAPRGNAATIHTHQWYSALFWPVPDSAKLTLHHAPLATTIRPGSVGIRWVNSYTETPVGYRGITSPDLWLHQTEDTTAWPAVVDGADLHAQLQWGEAVLFLALGVPAVAMTTGSSAATLHVNPSCTITSEGTRRAPYYVVACDERRYAVRTVDQDHPRTPHDRRGLHQRDAHALAIAPATHMHVGLLHETPSGNAIDWSRTHVSASTITHALSANESVVVWRYVWHGAEEPVSAVLMPPHTRGAIQPSIRPRTDQLSGGSMAPKEFDDGAVMGIRGPMPVVRQDSVEVRWPLLGWLPDLVEPAEVGALVAIDDTVFGHQAPRSLRRDDPYWGGKHLAHDVHLAQTLLALGDTTKADSLFEWVRNRLATWADTTESPRFWYDAAWQTVLSEPSTFGSVVDLNDHHFHYGYLIGAAAALERYGFVLADHVRALIDALVADVAMGNRSSKLPMPALRHFDPYWGHAWASGHGRYAAGNNQESSSESMYASVAMADWGAVTGQEAVRDLGWALFSTEVAAVNAYWYPPVPSGTRDSSWQSPTQRRFGLSTLVWANGSDYDTWFGSHPDFIHGIHQLPVGSYLWHTAQRPEVWAQWTERRRNVAPAWDNLHAMQQGWIDPDGALSAWRARPLSERTSESGFPPVLVDLWLQRLVHLGTWQGHIRRTDAPHGLVFNRDGRRTYVLWNGAGVAPWASFSDGTRIRTSPGWQMYPNN